MNHSVLRGDAAMFLFSITTAACSTATTTTAPQVGSATATTDASPSMCRVTGRPTVLAKHVFVPRGVEARAHEGGFEVRFATAPTHCRSVQWPLQSVADDAQEALCPGDPGVYEAIAEVDVKGASPSPRPTGLLGITVTAPSVGRDKTGTLLQHSVLRVLPGRLPDAATTGLTPIGSDRFLRLVVDGDYESHRLRAQVVASSGDAMGRTFDVSPPEDAVIGVPSAAIDANGDGVIAYLASRGDEFYTLAAPVACSMP
jgi:hypothetical protein